MVNISEKLAPYVFQFLPNGIIIFKGLPAELYDEAEKLSEEYAELCKDATKYCIPQISVSSPIDTDKLYQRIGTMLKKEITTAAN
jgi:hypothetical protein